MHDWSTSVAWSLLTDDERLRSLAFRSVVDRSRWIAAHAALRRVLGIYMGSRNVEFSIGRFGKPALCDPLGVRFNLAHSGDWALIAVARFHDVGVDVQEQTSIDDIEAVASAAFSAAEREALMDQSGQARIGCFYNGWTRKEALVKGLGLGLHADLTAFDVSLDPAPRRVLELSPPLPRQRWTLIDVPVDANHNATVAVQGIVAPMCRVFDFAACTGD